MRLVARAPVIVLLLACRATPGVGGASGTVPVRLLGARSLHFYVAYLAVLSPLTWLRMCRFVRYCVSVSVACAPFVWVCAHFSCSRERMCAWDWLKEESVSLMVYRVLDVVREFFLGEGVPDWAARGVADRGQRAHVAHLEATTVALNARR